MTKKNFSYHPTVTEEMIEWQCGTSLEEFCEDKDTDHYLDLSRRTIIGLGYVDSNMTLLMDHNVLTMVYEMHVYLPQALHLCSILEQLYLRFCYNKTKSFKESDGTQNDFLSVLIHVVDRVPARAGDGTLQQFLRIESTGTGKILNDDAIDLWQETEAALRKQRDVINSLDIPDSEKAKMHLELGVGDGEKDLGPPLDKGVYEMLILKQKGFNEDQDHARRNELKERIFHLGQICMIAHNNLQQPHGVYNALEVHFRRMFNNIKYSVADMMNQLTDQDDLTEV